VVHVEHGIARYGGLTKMRIRGVEGDFLVLQYEGADRLYLPVSKLRQVQKFSGAAPDAIRLDRLRRHLLRAAQGAGEGAALEMAAELSTSTPPGAAHHGFAFAAPDEVFREFEAEFPCEETPDQAAGHRRRPRRHDEGAGGGREARRAPRGPTWTGSSAATWATARPRWRCAPPMLAVLSRQAGGGAGPHHGARLAARADLPRALRAATRCAWRPSPG